jgi:glucosamine kinase
MKNLMGRFQKRFGETHASILENVYKKPLANRYLGQFCPFFSGKSEAIL